MILTQTKALFVDAYRELNARKLFWITMALSVVVAAAIATLGIDEKSVTFLWFRLDFLPLNTTVFSAKAFYLTVFSSLGIGLWLTWAATILALISTASIMPDLISGGVIETLLSKPISRWRLLFTKFLTGLMFVALQVGVFSVLSMLVIGIRGGYWEPRILLAIPIVVVFFSYLFSFSMLIGLLTRSTLAAILVTGVCWALIFGVNLTDSIVMQFTEAVRLEVEEREERVELATTNTQKLIRRTMEDQTTAQDYQPTRDEILGQNPFLEGMETELEENRESLARLERWNTIVFAVKTAVPKTAETIALLNRWTIDPDAFSRLGAESNEDVEINSEIEIDQSELQRRLDERYRARSLTWVVGSSLVFEGVILGLCLIVFRRRDF
ncbi:MAG: ABC transporter permease [Planctomycetota bacterium]